MTHEIQIGDYVLFLENRPVPDVQSVGLVGQVVDPGHKPPDSSKVYVSLPQRPRILGRSRKSGARAETGLIGRLKIRSDNDAAYASAGFYRPRIAPKE
jgi:hypothetical protein